MMDGVLSASLGERALELASPVLRRARLHRYRSQSHSALAVGLRGAELSDPLGNVRRVSIDVLSPGSAARLRADMVAAMQEKGRIRRPEVAVAFAKVPREVFGPEAKSLEAAYDVYDAIRTRFDETGRCTSSVSAPWLQADMIEMAGVREGDVVCEVGSGGYNAALLREIVGSAGRVVTVDIFSVKSSVC
jgi:protein-L-isoaspartate(D-aspartate) O-methyltransferase (PCMT)